MPVQLEHARGVWAEIGDPAFFKRAAQLAFHLGPLTSALETLRCWRDHGDLVDPLDALEYWRDQGYPSLARRRPAINRSATDEQLNVFLSGVQHAAGISTMKRTAVILDWLIQWHAPMWRTAAKLPLCAQGLPKALGVGRKAQPHGESQSKVEAPLS